MFGWKETRCVFKTRVLSLKYVGSKIISLVSFWCKTLLSGSLLLLSLILPLDTNDLIIQELQPLMSDEEMTFTEEEEEVEEEEGETTLLAQGDLTLMLGTTLDI